MAKLLCQVAPTDGKPAILESPPSPASLALLALLPLCRGTIHPHEHLRTAQARCATHFYHGTDRTARLGFPESLRRPPGATVKLAAPAYIFW